MLKRLKVISVSSCAVLVHFHILVQDLIAEIPDFQFLLIVFINLYT